MGSPSERSHSVKSKHRSKDDRHSDHRLKDDERRRRHHKRKSRSRSASRSPPRISSPVKIKKEPESDVEGGKARKEASRRRSRSRSTSRSKDRVKVKKEPESDVEGSRSRKNASRWRSRSRSTSRNRERVKVKEEPESDIEARGRKAEGRWRSRSRSRSRENGMRRDRGGDRPPRSFGRGRGGEEKMEWGAKAVKEEEVVVEKKKPSMALSGKLTEDTNTFKGVVIKYSEPPEAKKPKRKWRLYCFKGTESLPHIEIHRQSAYLLGRDRTVADIPIDHPSCSKQHAVLQFRVVPFTRDDGTTGRRVRPYIMDLESANGTFLNNQKIEPRRYVELLEKDMVKFGFSSREYIVLHADSAESDDEPEPQNN